MVGVQGFEPWTPWSQTRCATRLRYTPKLTWYYMWYEWNISRTICLFKKLFSFLYIRCKDFFFLFTLWCSNCCLIHWHIILLIGCGGRIRTSDLQLMRLAGTTRLPYPAIIYKCISFSLTEPVLSAGCETHL